MPPVPTMLGSTTITKRLVLAGPLSRLPLTAPNRFSTLSRGFSLSPRLSHKAFSTAPADAASPPSQTPPPRSRFRRFVGFTSIAIFAFTAGLVYQTSQTVSRMMTVGLTTDEETLSAFVPHDDFSKEVDEYIRTHPLAISLRENPAFTESRPHMKIPEHLRARTLTGGTLSGPDKIVAPPLVFCEDGGKSLVSIFYLGPSLCGHPGIVHGGLLATLLDEAMGRCCFPALPNKVGVTANLNLDYRKPAMAGNYAVLRAETVKVEGRKAWVEGRIETLPEEGQEPAVLVEAKALFIEPKQAAAMSTLYNITN
ncbi:thioesterase family protein [Aspergillus sclerotiicarbonarius CBS 121057]|uniref:Thioesterase family protein n=1 Tax=Aspergillus sclerotiicarbonarius (strain CBS 121057 / IBT 28362) TaxID=1448318 RepID=A0A319FP73_ASPSB|nr:thioesterase family protein [Aspergillus sclerotiicarbonarius CBS 121057]